MGRVKVTTSDLLDAIRASLPHDGRPDGEGWYTSRELSDQLGLSRAAVERWLAQHQPERRIGLMRDEGGQRRRVSFYRLKS